MLSALILRTEQALQPKPGWLPLPFLCAFVIVVTRAVADAGWSADGERLTSIALWAVLFTTLLVALPIQRRDYWLWCSAIGAVVVWTRLAALIPPVGQWSADWVAFTNYALEQHQTALSRFADSASQLGAGGRDSESAMLILVLAVLTWLLTCWLAWATWQTLKPLRPLATLLVLLAINLYFSRTEADWLLYAIVIAACLLAIARLRKHELRWIANGIDYPQEIDADIAVPVIGMVLLLGVGVQLAPAPPNHALSRWFDNAPFVVRIEDGLARIASGGGGSLSGDGPGSGGENSGFGSGRGVLPRQYLLGDAPELYETIIFTASLSTPDQPIQTTHWRSISYDVYTGRGWRSSADQQLSVPANQLIATTNTQETAIVDQALVFASNVGGPPITFGQLSQISRDSTIWRYENGDVAFGDVDGGGYLAKSLVSVASDNQLRSADTGFASASLSGRYTQLPADLPERVRDLALEITADAQTDFDKAVAIEQFLRQYPYTLDLVAPPRNVDIVDYFLFEQQAGYCDYYATAMTVLARLNGLPARLASGYAPVATSADGTQTLRQIDGHSWSEIYFPEYGWIEFEPTAGFGVVSDDVVEEEASAEPPPIPESQRAIRSRTLLTRTLTALAIIFAATVLIWRIQQRRRRARGHLSPALRAWADLLDLADQLRIPIPTGATPHETVAHLTGYLQRLAQHPRLQAHRHQQRIDRLQASAEATAAHLIATQYANANQPTAPTNIQPLTFTDSIAITRYRRLTTPK